MALTAARTKENRKRFERGKGRLLDRTQRGHTTIIQDSIVEDATAELVKRIETADFRELAPLLASADIGRVRPLLLAQAEKATMLDPNLAQGLALIGGASEVNVLRRHLRKAAQHEFASLSEDEQIETIYVAQALLSIRPSIRAAKLVTKAVRMGTPWTKQIAAELVSRNIISGSSIPVERILLGVLPRLLAGEAEVFVSAFPALFQRHYAKAFVRGKQLVREANPALRRHLLTILTTMPYYGLDVLVEAYEHQTELDLRLTIATAIAPALSKSQVERLVRDGLRDISPAVRLRAAELLHRVDLRVARRFAATRDPDPVIDAVLQTFRIANRKGSVRR